MLDVGLGDSVTQHLTPAMCWVTAIANPTYGFNTKQRYQHDT